ncbi:PucR family transcriptional regulator ligand-binding domain-containing protein, partial [Patulibacter sp. S7RM1-6]
MSSSLADLVRDPLLGLRVLAGADGLERRPVWAHACELAEPWDWLDRGDLLLSNGFGVPADAAGQERFVVRLDEAGIVGLVIGEKQHAPPLLDATVALADERGFPILECAYRVPFVAVAKAVGRTSEPAEQDQLQQLVRLYGRAREAAAREHEGASLLGVISRELDCRLWVLDPGRGGQLLPSAAPPPTLRRALVAAMAERDGRMPAATRV